MKCFMINTPPRISPILLKDVEYFNFSNTEIKKWLKKISFLLILVLIQVSVVGQSAPEIMFNEKNYDFGQIQEENGKVTHRFYYTNIGTADLIITSVRTSCGCQTVNYDKTKSVPPGQEGYIDVSYNPSKRPGAFNKSVSVFTNEPEMNVENPIPHKIYVMGTVIEGQAALSLSGGSVAPKVERYSETYFVGNLTTNAYPLTPEERKLKLEVKYNSDKGTVDIRPRGGEYHEGRSIHFTCGRSTMKLKSGEEINCWTTLDLDRLKVDNIVISSVTVQEFVGYGPKYKPSTFPVNISLDFSVWKTDWAFRKALKGGLAEEINYLEICPYDDHKTKLENDVVSNKVKNIEDIVYVNDNYPTLKYKLTEKMLSMISSISDCRTFLKYYNSYASKAEEVLYNLLKETQSQSDIDAYIEMFPTGKHITEMKASKTELQYYAKALDGDIQECATYISKYPNGRFVSEIQSRKTRLEQLKANSNKSLWKMGNKICHCNTYGVTMVTLDQWNEDKSNFKGIVVASPGGLYEGTILQKGNLLWIEPENWHKCLEDEIQYALNNDRSVEAEKLLSEKNMKFPRGTVVSQTFQTGWLFKFNNTITAKVEDWNDDFTKMKIQIVSTGGLNYFNGESIYEGKYIWVSPIGWQ